MKKIELAKATEALAEYVKTIGEEPVVIVHRGFALATLVPLGNMDYESIDLANNPQFLAILAEARASYERAGGVSSEEVRKLFEQGDSRQPSGQIAHVHFETGGQLYRIIPT